MDKMNYWSIIIGGQTYHVKAAKAHTAVYRAVERWELEHPNGIARGEAILIHLVRQYDKVG